MNDESNFGFYILRTVLTMEQNEYWIHCYNCIRFYHPTSPIIIINNQCIPNLVSSLPIEDENISVIEPEYSCCGPIMPYFYFYKNRPFDIAVFLQDTMFLQTKLELNQFRGMKFLWKDNDHQNEIDPFHQRLILLLRNHVPIWNLSCRPDNWTNCFSGMTICHWDAINQLQNAFHIFSISHAITVLEDQKAWNRVFSMCCHVLGLVEPMTASVFGEIHTNQYSWHDYIVDKETNITMKPIVFIV